MITLGALLDSILSNKSTKASLVLKLYYNAGGATDFIGVSDKTYRVGTVQYHGLASWRGYTQSADLINFAASQGAMSLVLDNKENGILAGRFSDLFATKNFVNRKWELYMEAGGNLSTDTIGQGRIGSDIQHDDLTVSMRLLHRKFTQQVPVNTIDAATYTKAPSNNIDAPIPIAYGDFAPSNADTTVGLDKRAVKGMFPAIISNALDIDAKPDSQVMNSLNTRHVAIRDDQNFAFCIDTAVTVLTATSGAGENVGPLITFGGTDYRIPLKVDNVEDTGPDDEANLIDNNLATTARVQSNANGTDQSTDFFLEPISGNGIVTDVIISINNDSVTALTEGFGVAVASYAYDGVTPSGASSDLYVVGATTDDSLSINAANRLYPVAGGKAIIEVQGKDTPTTEQGIMTTEEFTVDIQISPKQTFVQRTIKFDRVQGPFGSEAQRVTITDNREFGANVTFLSTLLAHPAVINRLTKIYELNGPEDLEYIFYSGKGREYGSWITDSGRSVGYAAAALIENPIYMVEDLIRTEGSITDIDTDSFDVSGNTTNGLITNVFDLAVGNVLFAFAQKSFTTLEGLWNQIGSMCGTIFFVSGSGKIKSTTRKRTADYTSADLAIEYGDIIVGKTSKTPINDVRNSITTKYDFDYVEDKTKLVTAAATDGTSQGTGVTGYNDTLIYEDAAPFILDSGTATGLNTYTLDLRKDQKRVIPFTSIRPKYQKLEVTDTINFVDWPSKFKVQGIAVASTDIWMVNSITKTGPDKVSIQVMEVS